jgi:uncharacterized protein involved in outer membrane biogenesis
MLKKILIAAVVLILVLSAGLFVWVRSVFTKDTVRVALAGQLSRTLGQPVTVGSIDAAIYPRVTVNLGQVTIGDPARIQVQTLHVGADFRALLSRRIEHARLELSGARVELPIPPFAIGADSTSGSTGSPVEIVSVDAIVLRGVEIVSGGRTMTGDVEVVPDGKGALLKSAVLRTEDATIDITGRITDLAGPVGEFAIKAGVLNLDRLLAFANDFQAGAGLARGTAAPTDVSANRESATATPMNIGVSLTADRATLGALALDRLAGQARITSEAMTLEPIGFGLFDGRYDGSLTFALGTAPGFTLKAKVAGIDVGTATAFMGSPGTISGRLSGNLDLAGRGTVDSSIVTNTRGTARVDIVDGVVQKLGLVRSVVLATANRSDVPMANAANAATESADEPFSKLGATLMIAGGAAATDDLRFESKDLLLTAAGAVRLDGSAINLAGQVQLSDELSSQAGRDLLRYTQEQGRVTLPATITGTAAAPAVRIDLASMAKRALTNRANEEVQKALKNGLGGLFRKR